MHCSITGKFAKGLKNAAPLPSVYRALGRFAARALAIVLTITSGFEATFLSLLRANSLAPVLAAAA
jgi:hypothetical protein